MTMTRSHAKAEREADAAADRARRARPGQRIRRQTLAQMARTKALALGNRARKREAGNAG